MLAKSFSFLQQKKARQVLEERRGLLPALRRNGGAWPRFSQRSFKRPRRRHIQDQGGKHKKAPLVNAAAAQNHLIDTKTI